MIRVLYLGDSSLDKFAYLACAFQSYGIEYEWYPEDKLPEVNTNLLNRFNVLCLSDCGAWRIGDSGLKDIEKFVKKGGGLIMFGGWETFQGINWRGELQGKYHATPVEDCLPVEISEKDDTYDSSHGYVMIKKCDHEILQNLDWSDAPTIGGFNEVKPKKDSAILLTLREIVPSGTDKVEKIALDEKEYPLLVTGTYANGASIAFTCDPTIHSVAQFVDWGKAKVVTLPDGTTRQIGENYLKLISRMVYWVAKEKINF